MESGKGAMTYVYGSKTKHACLATDPPQEEWEYEYVSNHQGGEGGKEETQRAVIRWS